MNRRARLKWCRDHGEWSMDHWATVLFTDDSQFSIARGSRCTFIWREPGIPYLPSIVPKIDHYSSEDLIIWVSIALYGRKQLHVLKKVLRLFERYVKTYAFLFRSAFGPDFILMNCISRPHRDNLIDEFLESDDIGRINWPIRTRDFNSIEHA
ncbi:transposable element Tc1 transposase [Trichonephila clavipes]|nr:transposable element Tc1 transposase [Trichonephila clavipes]